MFIAYTISVVVLVRTAIEFNDESRLHRNELNDVAEEGLLPPETHAEFLPRTSCQRVTSAGSMLRRRSRARLVR